MLKTAVLRTKKYLQKSFVGLKKSYNKKRKLYLILSISSFILLCSLIVYNSFFRIKENDDIFFLNSTDTAILGNQNPSFNVNFGKRDDPDTQWVRFEAKASSKNPFGEKEGNFFTKLFNTIKPKKEYGIEMSLEGVKMSETETLELDGREDDVKTVAEIIGTDEVKTSTELIDSGRIIGVYSEEPVSKKTVLNKEVAEGVDLEYQILEGLGLKEEIVIRDLDAYTKGCDGDLASCALPLNEFVFDLKLDEGLELKSEWVTIKGVSTETFYFVDVDGNYVAHFLPNWAEDSVGDKTYDVISNVEEKEDGNYRVEVIVDIEWLFSSERVYPVRIDPSIVHDTKSLFDEGIFNRTESEDGAKVSITKPKGSVIDANTIGYWNMDETTNGISATGGTVTYSGGYTIHTFTSGGTFTVNNGGNVEVLVVGGGGGGGADQGGGGGSGGYVYSPSTAVAIGSNTITVGGGGAGAAAGTANNGSAGASSSAFTFTAGGGAGGYGLYRSGQSGGNSGSGTTVYIGGTAYGDISGGAGGASVAANGGNASSTGRDSASGYAGSGAAGLTLMGISFGGGGGGGNRTVTQAGTASFGGGNGGYKANGANGTPNTGGGGGGGSWNSSQYGGGSGGSGIVIVRYPSTVIDDASSGNNNGTAMGSTSVEGKVGGARSFNGTSDYIHIGDVAAVDAASSLSACSWVKSTTDTDDDHIIGKVDSADNWSGFMFLRDDVGQNSARTDIYKIHASDGVTAAVIEGASNSSKLNEWKHVCFTYTSNNTAGLRLYVDGVEDPNSPVSTVGINNIDSNSANLVIGRYDPTAGNHFKGLIDAVALYTRVLSPSEIMNSYLNGVQKISGEYVSGVMDFGGQATVESLSWSDVGNNTGDGETPYSTTGLVAQWNFNETSGTTAVSGGSCGTGCNGTLTNMTTTGQDAAVDTGWTANNRKWGSGSLMFDGVNDYVNVGNVASLGFERTNAFSVGFWIKAPPTSNYYVPVINKLSWVAGAKGWRILSSYAGSSLVFTLTDNHTVSDISLSVDNVLDNNWHYVVFTYNGNGTSGGMTGYLDGKLYSSGGGGNLTSTTTNTIAVQIGGGPAYGKALMDNVQIYSRAISANEILSNYQAGNIEFQYRYSTDGNTWSDWGAIGDAETPSDITGLVAKWNFNETSGTTAVSGGSCGTACNATLTNFASTGSQDAAAGTGWTAIKKKWGTGSLMLDGVDDRVTVAHSSSLNITTGITIETWINPYNYDSSGYTHILDKDSTYGFSLYQGKPALFLNGAGNWWMPTVAPLVKNQWHHLVATFDGSYKRIYLNGVMIAEAAQTGTLGQTSNPIGLACRQDGTLRVTGIIDSTRLYSRGLSASEVLSNYRAGWEEGIENFNNPYLYDPEVAGLVSYYPMDEMSGTAVGDVAGTNNGIATGTRIVDGTHGKARSFNGTSDYVGIPDSNDWALGTGNFTIESWVSFADIAGHRAIIGQRQDATNFMSMYWNTNNKLYFHAIDNGVWRADYNFTWTPNVNTWYHIAAVRSGSTFNIYLNGVPQSLVVTTAIGSNSIGNIGGVLGIGLAETFYMKGLLDDVAIYNSALDSNTIQKQYIQGADKYGGISTENSSNVKIDGNSNRIEAGVSSIDHNTVGYWKFDETGGTGAFLKDYSGNNYHGTPSGTTYVEGKVGGARNFVSANGNYVGVGTSINLVNKSFSVEAWAKRDTLGSNHLFFGQGVYLTSQGLHVGFRDTNVFTCAFYGNDLDTVATYTDYQWHHWACTYDASTRARKIYRDGVVVASATATANYSGTGAFNIGAGYSNATSSFNGSLDEVRVSDRVRSTEEIVGAYMRGKDRYVNKVLGTSINLTNKTKIPFWIASDTLGDNIDLTYGDTPYANNQPDSNTVGLWRMNEIVEDSCSGGQDICDTTGLRNHGVVTGTTIVDGINGKARSFNGTSDWVSIPDSSSLDLTNAISISAWIKPADVSTERFLIEKRTLGENDSNYYLSSNGGRLLFGFYSGTTWYQALSAVGDIVVNTWTHITVTYDQSNVKFYINSRQTASSPLTAVMTPGTGPLVVGRAQYAAAYRYYSGLIEEIQISNTARTPLEIRDAYEIGLRTHPVRVEFKADLQSSNLITGSGDTSFTISEIPYGRASYIENLNPGDKVIVKENYDGIEYIAQGNINTLNKDTGAVTVTWDASSTFPSVGYSIKATVFKWQKEYIDIRGTLNDFKDNTSIITLRTKNQIAATYWIDDIKGAKYATQADLAAGIMGEYRYFQYKPIFSTYDTTKTTPYLTSVQADYGLTSVAPTMEQIMRHGKWFKDGARQPFWWGKSE